MTNFAYKFARAFLLFYCLTPPHMFTKCENNQEKRGTVTRPPLTENSLLGVFALVKRINEAGICGSAWINSRFLITAASCLDAGVLVLQLEDLMTTKYDVEVLAMEKLKTGPGYRVPQGSKPPIELAKESSNGQAILHPLYRKSLAHSQGMPIAYDVAVVKVHSTFKEAHEIINLCNPNFGASWRESYSAIGVDGTPYTPRKRLTEWKELMPEPNKLIAVYKGAFVWINDSYQFTIHIADTRPIFIKGLPLIIPTSDNICVAGIMSFIGRKNGFYYITSTKVYTQEVHDWINHAQNTLKIRKKMPIKNKGKFGKIKLKKAEQEVRSTSAGYPVIQTPPGLPNP